MSDKTDVKIVFFDNAPKSALCACTFIHVCTTHTPIVYGLKRSYNGRVLGGRSANKISVIFESIKIGTIDTEKKRMIE